jgi:DNA invertase Pin-like site-specific DNA recombinase
VTSKPRAVAVVRVSAQGDRAEEHFHSPDVQLDSAKRWARKRRERFVAHFPEIDVSGKRPLVKRPGLLGAVEMVEAGQADHIVVAYFDRLVRSLKVQLEVIERVERAGGEIFALDHGKLTNGTAATRLSTNMMGAVFQYFAEVTGEKVTAAQARAVARGVLPNSRIVPGYLRGEDGVLVVERPKARTSCRRSGAVTAARRSWRSRRFWPRMGSSARSPAWSRCCARGCISVRSTSASFTTCTPTSRSSGIARYSSGCSGGRSRAAVRPSLSGFWRAWVCCAAGRAGRGW